MLKIHKVLCPIAGTEESNMVIDVALDIAQRHNATLTVLNVAPLNILNLMKDRGHLGDSQDLLPGQVDERLDRHSAAVLERAKSHLGDNEAVYQRIVGHPSSVICEVAEQDDFDLIVIGHRKHNLLHDMLLGSVASQVVQRSPCPILVVRYKNKA